MAQTIARRDHIVAIVYPGCIIFEIMLALELLSKKYDIVVASPDGKDHISSSGITVTGTSKYADVDLAGCRGLLIPGGNPISIVENKEIDILIQNANSKGLLLAAICAGPSILAKAGVLNGKRVAHGYQEAQLEYLSGLFEQVEFADDLLLADGNVLTAKPQAHIDFGVEVACRLQAADASKSGRLKDYYKGTLGKRIRPLALAYIKNQHGQILLHRNQDSVKNETFYRPLGGGIEFHESGVVAIEREIFEEIGQRLRVSGLVASFENIFVYEGRPGHEVVMLFAGEFIDRAIYDLQEIDIVESGQVINKAVWRSVEEIRAEGAKLYPNGLEDTIVNAQLADPAGVLLYEGTIVEESLQNPSLLNEIRISRVHLSTPSKWHIYSVLVGKGKIQEFQSELRDGPWYAHFWNGDELVIVFKDRCFTVSREKTETWSEAIEFGGKIGIPPSQLDFLTDNQMIR